MDKIPTFNNDEGEHIVHRYWIYIKPDMGIRK